MRKTLDRCFIGLLLLISLISSSAIADNQSSQRLDPSLRILVEEALQLPNGETSIQSLLEGGSYEFSWSPAAKSEQIKLLVKLDRSFPATSFHGLPVTASTGSILGVSATIQQILAMLEDEDVVYIEPSRQTSPTLDVSLPAVHADGLHSSIPAIAGAGVIVGAIDTGIDYTHLDFRYDSDDDGFEESSRILAILDQSHGLFGMEYSRQDIETDLANGHGPNEGIVRQKDTDGHGTHVMGIAAG
ncbi:S8 family serine peptidase, partial [Candidatus Bipolaricaulota bacterium]